MLKIAIGSDHAGVALKDELQAGLSAMGAIIDYGCFSTQPSDYPDFAHQVAAAVQRGEADFGMLFCGSANGMAIAANKHEGVRAAVCWSGEIATLARAHNDANILCLPARFIDKEEAAKTAQLFLQTPFEGGRHVQRVKKIDHY